MYTINRADLKCALVWTDFFEEEPPTFSNFIFPFATFEINVLGSGNKSCYVDASADVQQDNQDQGNKYISNERNVLCRVQNGSIQQSAIIIHYLSAGSQCSSCCNGQFKVRFSFQICIISIV